jgi:hypothetical protein
MATVDETSALADAEEVMRLVSEGKRVTDPDLRRRVRERADAARRAMLERFGVTDMAVEIIREARDE